ncbi:hypothetical protein AGDE_09386 [Angomonas deanei]|nr:hypothetical protein AGDE_09386 [Angomonas deanei]|eukprot:EPY30552.1 hypothetical protein AGDE_09386 [Angomonas deanei]
MPLSETAMSVVEVAYYSMDVQDKGKVSLEEVLHTFNAVEHPRVKEGEMAPSQATARVKELFSACAADHDGYITFHEFAVFHEKLAEEANFEKVPDTEEFIKKTIMAMWRLGDILLPTGIRPAFPTNQKPTGLYASTLMTFLWVDKDEKGYVLKGMKDCVRPIFSRGDLPEEVQGMFAYPNELVGMEVQFVPTQVALQNFHDFVWEYEEGKYCGVEGIISARVDPRALPDGVRQFIMPHAEAVGKQCEYIKTQKVVNPMYKKSSENYGYGVQEELKKMHIWKVKSLQGKQYGLQYYGLVGKYFANMKKNNSSTAATGMNLK